MNRSLSVLIISILLLSAVVPSLPKIYAGTFPGVNGKIAFTSVRDGNFEVYIMNADGTGQTNLSNNVASDLLPSWSPDGKKIAFSSNRDGNFEVYVMNADGSGQTNLSNNVTTDLDPSWSPDGTKIAFTKFTGGDFEIFVMNADGTGQTNLSNHVRIDRSPDWGPAAAIRVCLAEPTVPRPRGQASHQSGCR